MDENTNERAVIGGNNPPTTEEILAQQYDELMSQIEPLAERANKLPKKISTEADLELVTPVVVDAKALAKKIESAREKAKAPFLKGGREVDDFFRAGRDRMSRVATVFERLAGDYQREKIARERREAEEASRREAEKAEKLRKEAEEVKRPETKQKRLDAAAEAENAADRAAAAGNQKASELGKVVTTGGTARAQAFWNFSIENYGEVDLNSIRDFIDREAVEKAIRAKIKIQKGNTEIPGVKVFEDVRSSIQ